MIIYDNIKGKYFKLKSLDDPNPKELKSRSKRSYPSIMDS